MHETLTKMFRQGCGAFYGECACSRPLPSDCRLTVGNRMLAHLISRHLPAKDLTLCFLCAEHTGATDSLMDAAAPAIADMGRERKRRVAYSIRGGGAAVLAMVDWRRIINSDMADTLLLLALDQIRKERDDEKGDAA